MMLCLTCGYWEATIGSQCESCATSNRPDHNGSDTSRAAAADNRPKRPRDRERVLEALTAAGEMGLTDFELAEVLTRTGPTIGQTSAGKRRLDLEREGLVARRLVIAFQFDLDAPVHYPADVPRLVPDRRPSPTKSSAGVYVLAHYSEPTAL